MSQWVFLAKCFMSFFHLPIVLLYVRTGAEEVFDALMLSTPTLSGLRKAVSNTLTHMHEYSYLTWFPYCCLNFTCKHTLCYPSSMSSFLLTVVSYFFPPSGFRKVRHAKRHHWENLQEMQERVSYFGMPNALLLYNWLNTPVGLKECFWHRRSA